MNCQVDLERSVAELSLGVRLRVALDVLERLAEEGVLLSRRSRSSRMRLARISVDEDGLATVPGEGDTSGALELTWELLAARIAARSGGEGEDEPGLLDGLDEVPEAISDSIVRSVRGGIDSTAGLFSALDAASGGHVDTNDDVRRAFDRLRQEANATMVEEPLPAAVAAPALPLPIKAPPSRVVMPSPSAPTADDASGPPPTLTLRSEVAANDVGRALAAMPLVVVQVSSAEPAPSVATAGADIEAPRPEPAAEVATPAVETVAVAAAPAEMPAVDPAPVAAVPAEVAPIEAVPVAAAPAEVPPVEAAPPPARKAGPAPRQRLPTPAPPPASEWAHVAAAPREPARPPALPSIARASAPQFTPLAPGRPRLPRVDRGGQSAALSILEVPALAPPVLVPSPDDSGQPLLLVRAAQPAVDPTRERASGASGASGARRAETVTVPAPPSPLPPVTASKRLELVLEERAHATPSPDQPAPPATAFGSSPILEESGIVRRIPGVDTGAVVEIAEVSLSGANIRISEGGPAALPGENLALPASGPLAPTSTHPQEPSRPRKPWSAQETLPGVGLLPARAEITPTPAPLNQPAMRAPMPSEPAMRAPMPSEPAMRAPMPSQPAVAPASSEPATRAPNKPTARAEEVLAASPRAAISRAELAAVRAEARRRREETAVFAAPATMRGEVNRRRSRVPMVVALAVLACMAVLAVAMWTGTDEAPGATGRAESGQAPGSPGGTMQATSSARQGR